MSLVTDHLAKRGVPFSYKRHERTTSALEEAVVLHADPGAVAKTLLVVASRGFIAAVVPADQRLDMHTVHTVLGDPHARLATETEIEDSFPGFELGALPPLASLLHIPVYVDPALINHRRITFADGWQTESVTMEIEDLLRAESVTITPLSEGDVPSDSLG